MRAGLAFIELGFDERQIGAVKEGNIAMTVELNPVLWGRLGVDVLATFLKGDKVEPRVFIKHVVIDSSNVDEVLAKMAPPKS